MNRILLFVMILWLFSAVANAQIRQSFNTISAISEAKQKQTNEETKLKIDALQDKEKEEFVLYRNVVRKYIWFEGVGDPISQDVADHLPYYYKMTMKNAAGHWQHVESLHRNQPSAAHPISTYVLDKTRNADDTNKEWVDRLCSVTQWVFISSLDGKEVFEERAYDADGNMMYSFQPILNSEGRIMGSYNDAWGLPADLREDSTTTYGSVVCITYNSNGYDSIVDYLDGQGLRKLNLNGVDQERYIYGNDGRLLRITSHNLAGDFILDDWGNCGNEYRYDDASRTRSTIRLDKDLQPMRMPALKADGTQTYVRCDVALDKWGRDSIAIMLDANGNKDATLMGIHKIVYYYNDDGTMNGTDYFDKQGKRIMYPQSDLAKRED